MNQCSQNWLGIFRNLLPFSIFGVLCGCGSEAVGGMENSWQTEDPRAVPTASVCTDAQRRLPEQCNGADSNCDGFVHEDLVVTECAQKLIEYIGIVAEAQAKNADASRRLPMGCPAESGLGEAQQDFYSYTGPLPKSCNRIVADDCDDPERKNYWVMVLANRAHPASWSYQVLWGSDPGQYAFYNGCPPIGFDGEGSSIPKQLVAVHDVNGDGSIGSCAQNHVAWVSFETGDPKASSPIPVKDITAVRDLRVTNKLALLGDDQALQYEFDHPVNLAVDVRLPNRTWVQTRVNSNFGGLWLKWKQPLRCQ